MRVQVTRNTYVERIGEDCYVMGLLAAPHKALRGLTAESVHARLRLCKPDMDALNSVCPLTTVTKVDSPELKIGEFVHLRGRREEWKILQISGSKAHIYNTDRLIATRVELQRLQRVPGDLGTVVKEALGCECGQSDHLAYCPMSLGCECGSGSDIPSMFHSGWCRCHEA